MRPLLGKLISLRISEDEHQAYTRAAAELGISFSEYVRLRLVSVGNDYVAEQIAQLRLTLLDNTEPFAPDQTNPSLSLETLLLLRRICPPGAVRGVQSELKRLGYSPWKMPSESDQ